MARTGKRRRGHDIQLPRGDSTGRVERPKRVASRRRRTAPQDEGSWFLDKRGALRFVVLLAVGVFGFNALFLVWVSPSELFEAYLRLIAGTTAGVLQVFGDDARVTGTSIFSSRFSLNIERGCDAIQVSAFFVFAVLAWPASVSRWRRATGVALGTLVLLTLNLVRIVSLYYTGIYLPGAFDRLHLDVWQPGFVVLALLLWMIWVQWVTRTETARPDVSV